MNSWARRLLPSLPALQTLIVAARLESFSRAASELGLTQGGVSRQIAQLEDWLQMRLFERVGRRVQLTSAGREYVEAITPAIERIKRSTARALERRPERELAIATLPSFGMRWLAPRLPDLSAEAGELVISFAAKSVAFDFAEERFDAAIHFGADDWPGVMHDVLFVEEMVAVISPILAEKLGVRQPSDILKAPLLSLESRRSAWSTYCSTVGVEHGPPEPNATFEQFLMLAQAAVAGAGAALMPTFLIEPELASGALIAPFEDVRLSTGQYFLVYPPERMASEPFQKFREWIIRETTKKAPI